jgi:valyl-tRNA synthetase
MPRQIPDKPRLEGLEERWVRAWEEDGTYRFDRISSRAEVYAIDTPPPTVSGALHIGHACSYTHTDLIARYRRMRGFEVFYPMGWDDNGLPTERRVQNYYGVRCDPSLPYVPGFRPPVPGSGARRGEGQVPVSRPNFIELCNLLTTEDERTFEEVWRRLGLSVDWSMTYTTIGERARRASQAGFLGLLESGMAYTAEAPTLWDVDYRTAVAQAELEDREVPGAYHRIRFGAPEGAGGSVEIETTRPELLPACVALVANPDDGRYRPLFGARAVTPLFGAPVPILPHPLAEPDKGTGLAMVCTFGDVTDITWWRDLDLPLRIVLGLDGRIVPVPWGSAGWDSVDPGRAAAAHAELAGLRVERARDRVRELLAADGLLAGEPRPIVHPVKFYEKGERPLEILATRQWFVRTLDLREELLERGRELRWHPPHMVAKYESWVNGLNSDWCVSRQRFFGVPFPVWYPIGQDGTVDHASPLIPSAERLPVDPSTDAPDGFAEEQRGRPGGFAGDPDVMDTWATSSLSPQIAGGRLDDPDLFARVFPMDLRPQSHEIIRTWLFYSVVRSHLMHGTLPWSDVAISGWVVDPDRKKMSKSKGNVTTPMGVLERYGSDAVRYWAARARLGTDTTFDEAQIKVGRRLAIKVMNASRFILSRPGEPGPVVEPLDRSLLVSLAGVVEEATRELEDYEHAGALERVERFFWSFCDDYLELVKGRSYREGAGAASAAAALRLALETFLRLFAPYLPFVTEEVWSWWREGSIHRAGWPDANALREAAGDGDPAVLEVAGAVLGEVRRAKSTAHLSPRDPVARVVVHADAGRLALLAQAEGDVRDAGSVAELSTSSDAGDGELRVQVLLSRPDTGADGSAGAAGPADAGAAGGATGAGGAAEAATHIETR